MNLKEWLPTIGNSQLKDVYFNLKTDAAATKGEVAFTESIRFSTPEMQIAWANRYLSEDVGKGVAGNAFYKETDPVKQPYQWHGRGLKQLTHQDNYKEFGKYLDSHLKGVITSFDKMTFEQAFSDNPNRLFDRTDRGILRINGSELSERGRMLQVASAAWFWSERVKLNTLADELQFDGTDGNKKGNPFYQITQKVNGGQTSATDRFKAYKDMQTKATQNGNAYENMVNALSRLGLSAKGVEGYKDQFGIALKTRKPFIFNKLQAAPTASDVSDQLTYLAQAMELPVEELTMFIDAPLDQAGSPTMYVVAKNQNAQAAKNNVPNKLGVCGEYRANDIHPVRPIYDAEEYFLSYKKGPAVVAKENNNLQIRTETQIEVAKQPRHGRLSLFKPDATNTDISRYDYHYTPDKDYVGLDNFEFLISVDGKSLKVYYQVKVFPEDESPNYVGYCNWEKPTWKISQLLACS